MIGPDREPQTGETTLRGMWMTSGAGGPSPEVVEYTRPILERAMAEGRDTVAVSGYVWRFRALATAQEPDTRPASVAGLGEAWAEAEAALPEGWWYISNVRRRSPNGRYSASATLGYSDTGESMSGFGPTPADALRALAQRFREPPFVDGPSAQRLREHSDPGAAREAG